MKAILVINIPEEFDKALIDGRCGIEYQVFTNYTDSELIYENEYQTLKPAPSEYVLPRNAEANDVMWYLGYNKCVREVIDNDSH